MENPRYSVRLEKNGRVVIPASIRRELDLQVGAYLSLRVEDGEIKLITKTAALERARKILRKSIPEGTMTVDDFLEWRKKDSGD